MTFVNCKNTKKKLDPRSIIEQKYPSKIIIVSIPSVGQPRVNKIGNYGKYFLHTYFYDHTYDNCRYNWCVLNVNK